MEFREQSPIQFRYVGAFILSIFPPFLLLSPFLPPFPLPSSPSFVCLLLVLGLEPRALWVRSKKNSITELYPQLCVILLNQEISKKLTVVGPREELLLKDYRSYKH